MYIYIDVLLLLNIYVNYFLLKATAKITHTPLRTGRCIFSGILGSFSALIILVPEINSGLLLMLKLMSAFIVTGMAFGFNKRTLRLSFWFLGVNFAFAGIMFLLQMTLNSGVTQVHNAVVYVDFSVTYLLIFTFLAYIVICIFSRMFNRVPVGEFKILIRQSAKFVILQGLSDTGNMAIDCLSGKSVIICRKQSLKELIGQRENPKTQEDIFNIYSDLKDISTVSVETVNGNGFIPVFSVDEVLIKNTSTGESKSVSCMIGIAEIKRNIAIFNPKLLV